MFVRSRGRRLHCNTYLISSSGRLLMLQIVILTYNAELLVLHCTVRDDITVQPLVGVAKRRGFRGPVTQKPARVRNKVSTVYSSTPRPKKYLILSVFVGWLQFRGIFFSSGAQTGALNPSMT